MSRKRLLGQRPELADWLKGLGVEPDNTYRVEIVISVGQPATLTAYQYDRDEQGKRYLVWTAKGKQAALREPLAITIDTLPNVPPLPSLEESEE